MWFPIDIKDIETDVLWALINEVASFEGAPKRSRSISCLRKDYGFDLLGAVVSSESDEDFLEAEYLFLAKTHYAGESLYYVCFVWTDTRGYSFVRFSDYGMSIGDLTASMMRSEHTEDKHALIALLDAILPQEQVSSILLSAC